MRVMVAHCAYKLHGGEDAVVESEVEMLRAHGHEVVEYRRHNDEVTQVGSVRAAAGALWSRRTVSEIGRLFKERRPQILHVHNTLPLISPSIYWAGAAAGVPVVQTLHNFRLLCPQAMLLRDGRVCESCVGHMPLPGVIHGCYRGSRLQTGVLAGTLVLHRGLGTWAHKVHRYIALNEFCRAKFIQGGLPAERISIKPNFVDLPPPSQQGPARSGLLFVGRLSPEKGTAVLAAASRAMRPGAVRVAGSGPSAGELQGIPGIVAVGALDRLQVADAMSRAIALVMPSIWYENFPRTLVEAFACGLPVIASRLGALAGIVDDGVTGLHFEVNNAADLTAKMQWALAHPDRMAAMGHAARLTYEREYTPQTNHRQLLEIYEQAIACNG